MCTVFCTNSHFCTLIHVIDLLIGINIKLCAFKCAQRFKFPLSIEFPMHPDVHVLKLLSQNINFTFKMYMYVCTSLQIHCSYCI